MALPAEESVSTVSEPLVAPVKIHWFIFFSVLLAPALLTLLVSFLGRSQANEPISSLIAFFGGIAAGIACGIMLALRLGKTVSGRLGIGLLFSCIFVVICVTLNFFGCMAGGFQFGFK